MGIKKYNDLVAYILTAKEHMLLNMMLIWTMRARHIKQSVMGRRFRKGEKLENSKAKPNYFFNLTNLNKCLPILLS